MKDSFYYRKSFMIIIALINEKIIIFMQITEAPEQSHILN